MKYNFIVCTVKFTQVAGKCYLTYSENLNEPVDEWAAAGPSRFYFTEAYNAQEKSFDEPPYHAISIGKSGKGKGNLKLKSKKTEESEKKSFVNKPIEYKTISKTLRTLDVFAGCGGMCCITFLIVRFYCYSNIYFRKNNYLCIV